MVSVKDVMHPDADVGFPDMAFTELARRMRDGDVGSISIGDNDRLVGMVTDRDIAVRAVAEERDPKAMTARDGMTGEIAWCYDDIELAEAGRIMASHGVRRLPVVNRGKRLVGMLSVGDLTAASPALAGEALRPNSRVEGNGPAPTTAQ